MAQDRAGLLSPMCEVESVFWYVCVCVGSRLLLLHGALAMSEDMLGWNSGGMHAAGAHCSVAAHLAMGC